jgi:hypothetical protein
MSATGQPQGLGDFKEYTSGQSDATTWLPSASGYADYVQVIGAGTVVVTTEKGNNRTITTDAAEPAAVIRGPFSALVSTTATRVRMGIGAAPPISPPVTGVASGSTIADAGGFTAQTTVEGALQELYQHLFSAKGGCVPIPLSSFREVSATGDVGDIAAIGGVLASDTAPILLARATTNDHVISWATTEVDPIGVSLALPNDFDDTADAYLDLEVSSGSTDAATIVVASSWGGGAEVSDSTSDVATKSATQHVLEVVIAHGDIPAAAACVSFRLTPPAHAANAILLHGARLKYKRKLLTA